MADSEYLTNFERIAIVVVLTTCVASVVGFFYSVTEMYAASRIFATASEPIRPALVAPRLRSTSEREEPEEGVLAGGFVKKSTADVYSFRFDSGYCRWATIVLRPNGQVFIQSDAGDWGYWWGHRGGESIEQFLLTCDVDYLMNKFEPRPTEFDADASISRLKETIIDARKRETVIDKNRARDLWDDVVRMSQEDVYSDESLARAIYDHPWFHEYYGGCDFPIVKHKTYGLRKFMELVWPVFMEALAEQENQRFQQAQQNKQRNVNPRLVAGIN